MLPRRRTKRAVRSTSQRVRRSGHDEMAALRENPVALIARDERYWVFFSARRGHRTIVLLEVVRRVESKVQRDTEGLGGWIHFFLGIPSKPGLPG